MAEQSDTLVFVPAWNEEENLPAVLEELHKELPGADVLVVDDGSTDGTAGVAAEHGADVLSFGANRGLPAAISGGYGYAVEHGYEYCGRVDADGQHPADELRRLLERVRADTCDVAVGSRYASGDGFESRRYEATRSRLLDATSGLYAANAKALPVLARPYDSTAPEVQALLRLAEAGLRVDEVPVHMRERASGESKLRGKKAIMVVLTVAGTLITFEGLRRARGRR